MRAAATRLGVLIALLAWICAMPGRGEADTLTFVRDANVWLANADGTAQYQVTFDGTTAAPYESPSLADDGTVVAVREAPGERRKIYRMSQSGALLNAPINTPAPGTGAIDAKVSPNGQLVAYWFVTAVTDPICVICVQLASQVLISRSDRFTGPSEVGTPNTGIMPSWISNDTLLLSNSNATQWYYRLGMPEAVQWFADPDTGGDIKLLNDGEVARGGDRLALVRGDNAETLLIYALPAPLPAIPARPVCGFQGPSGRFVGPTWSNDGRLLAWREDDGIWTSPVASLTDCAAIGPARLLIRGAAEPDLGPAPLAPGPRPACAQPGNPRTCPPPDLTPPQTAFRSKPAPATRSRSARFVFRSSEIGSTFLCAVDKKRFARCRSPLVVKVKVGKHTFRVRAVDRAGNADRSPATWRWTVKA